MGIFEKLYNGEIFIAENSTSKNEECKNAVIKSISTLPLIQMPLNACKQPEKQHELGKSRE